jgi:hypothetical protein
VPNRAEFSTGPLPLLGVVALEQPEMPRHDGQRTDLVPQPHIVERAGGVWEPGRRRWLIRRKCMGTLIRALEASTAAAAVTDPLFSWAGVSLD